MIKKKLYIDIISYTNIHRFLEMKHNVVDFLFNSTDQEFSLSLWQRVGLKYFGKECI